MVKQFRHIFGPFRRSFKMSSSVRTGVHDYSRIPDYSINLPHSGLFRAWPVRAGGGPHAGDEREEDAAGGRLRRLPAKPGLLLQMRAGDTPCPHLSYVFSNFR